MHRILKLTSRFFSNTLDGNNYRMRTNFTEEPGTPIQYMPPGKSLTGNGILAGSRVVETVVSVLTFRPEASYNVGVILYGVLISTQESKQIISEGRVMLGFKATGVGCSVTSGTNLSV